MVPQRAPLSFMPSRSGSLFWNITVALTAWYQSSSLATATTSGSSATTWWVPVTMPLSPRSLSLFQDQVLQPHSTMGSSAGEGKRA